MINLLFVVDVIIFFLGRDVLNDTERALLKRLENKRESQHFK